MNVHKTFDIPAHSKLVGNGQDPVLYIAHSSLNKEETKLVFIKLLPL